jgi:hypothetical protein
MKTLKITATFPTIKEAVLASDIDLSFNRPLALRDLDNKRLTDDVVEAYICEDGNVYYVYKVDITLLNKYHPFGSCISYKQFELCFIERGEVVFSNIMMDDRKKIKALQALNPVFLAHKG